MPNAVAGLLGGESRNRCQQQFTPSGHAAAQRVPRAIAIAAAGCMAVAASSAMANGVTVAKAQLGEFVAKPKSIGSFTRLTKAPPKGKMVVYLATSEVSNVQVAAGVEQAAGRGSLALRLGELQPGQPVDVPVRVQHRDREARQLRDGGGYAAAAAGDHRGQAHHIKIALDAVYPAKVTGPVIDSQRRLPAGLPDGRARRRTSSSSTRTATARPSRRRSRSTRS